MRKTSENTISDSVIKDIVCEHTGLRRATVNTVVDAVISTMIQTVLMGFKLSIPRLVSIARKKRRSMESKRHSLIPGYANKPQCEEMISHHVSRLLVQIMRDREMVLTPEEAKLRESILQVMKARGSGLAEQLQQ